MCLKRLPSRLKQFSRSLMQIKANTVSEVLLQIKQNLEGNFFNLLVEGEVSNLSSSSAGHYYFTLSDTEGSLSVALFRADAMRNPLVKKLRDGDQVCCHGSISVYNKRGTFQLIARRVFVVGKGDLLQQLEELKHEFLQKGYFSLERKKKIPHFPRRVAVITALQGAALRDFINVYRRRRILGMDILIVPSLVQGAEAPQSLINALKRVETLDSPIDVIVMTRGGGSLEDLWAFNDRQLIEAIYRCPIPLISAVGHHVDVTLCDYVSDLRAETPTAAAELLTEGQRLLFSKQRELGLRFQATLKNFNAFWFQRLEKVRPHSFFAILLQRVNISRIQLGQVEKSFLKIQTSMLTNFYLRLDDGVRNLQRLMDLKILSVKRRFERCDHVLHSLNPKLVLNRGYTIVLDEKGMAISSAVAFSDAKSSQFKLEFHDGTRLVQKIQGEEK